MLVTCIAFPFFPVDIWFSIIVLGVYGSSGSIFGCCFRYIFGIGAANSPKDDGGGLSLLGYSILESFKETSLWLFFLLYCDLILEL